MLQFGLTLITVASDQTVFVKDVPGRDSSIDLHTPAAIEDFAVLMACMSQLGFSAVEHAVDNYDIPSSFIPTSAFEFEVDMWVKLARLQWNGSLRCMSLAPFLHRLVII